MKQILNSYFADNWLKNICNNFNLLILKNLDF